MDDEEDVETCVIAVSVLFSKSANDESGAIGTSTGVKWG